MPIGMTTGLAYREFEDAMEERIIIHHDMGYKWSSYLKAHTERVIKMNAYDVPRIDNHSTIVSFYLFSLADALIVAEPASIMSQARTRQHLQVFLWTIITRIFFATII